MLQLVPKLFLFHILVISKLLKECRSPSGGEQREPIVEAGAPAGPAGDVMEDTMPASWSMLLAFRAALRPPLGLSVPGLQRCSLHMGVSSREAVSV